MNPNRDFGIGTAGNGLRFTSSGGFLKACSLNEPVFFEKSQVLCDGRKAHLKRMGNIGAGGAFFLIDIL